MPMSNEEAVRRMHAASLSRSDRDYIRGNMDELSPEQICLDLNKSLKVIKRFIEKTRLLSTLDGDGKRKPINKYLSALKGSPEYALLTDELTEPEREYFEHSYCELIKQFKGDVLATERIQICQVIKLAILMSRNLAERKRATLDIVRLEAELVKIYKDKDSGPLDDNQRHILESLEGQLASSKSAQKIQTTEYTKLMESHRHLMEALKATRDQRIEKIEQSAESFLNYIRLLQSEEQNEAAGRYAELMRMAAEKEAMRLAQPHTYADGRVDQPLLNSDTVKIKGRPETYD